MTYQRDRWNGPVFFKAHNSSCLTWRARMCAIKYPHFVFPQENSLAILLSENIAVNWSDSLTLGRDEYWLHIVSRHHMSFSLSAVYFTSIPKIATCFVSGLDSDSATIFGCENEMVFSSGTQLVFCSRDMNFYSCHTQLRYQKRFEANASCFFCTNIFLEPQLVLSIFKSIILEKASTFWYQKLGFHFLQ